MTPEIPSKHIPAAVNRLMPRSLYSMSTAAIAAKVLEDIHFLQDRIDRIKRLRSPDAAVLGTYQSMLDSRELVLQWLRENEDFEEHDAVQTQSLGRPPGTEHF